MVDLLQRQAAPGGMTTNGPGPTFPAEIERIFREFRCAEMATIAKDGTPLAWPIVALYRPQRGCFVTTTSIALPQKAYTIRRNGKVSLLFSDRTGSGLDRSAAVLVQGEARVAKEVATWNDDLRDLWQLLAVRQPASNVFSSNAVMRWLMPWYYMRLVITIVPFRARYWADGDFAQVAKELEVQHVG